VRIPLHTKTTGGDTGRKISSMSSICCSMLSPHIHSLVVPVCKSGTVLSGATSAPADAQSKHSQHARSMTAAPRIRKQVLWTQYLLLSSLQAHVLAERRDAAHTGIRSNVCVEARCRCRQASPRVRCRGPRCLREGEKLILLLHGRSFWKLEIRSSFVFIS